jgi:exonuclease SbcD
MVDYARKEKPELLLIGGDLFDIMRPGNYARAAAMEDFRLLHEAGVKVFAVGGHHDTPRSIEEGTSPLAVYGNSGFIHYFSNPSSPEMVTLDYHGFNVTITGVGHNPLHDSGTDPIDAVPKELKGDYNIVIAHSPVQGFSGWTGDEPVIKPSSIPKQVNLLAVGHFHNHQSRKVGNTEIIYPGSTERVDFAEEPDEKGFVWVEFEKDGTLRKEFKKTSARRYKTVRIEFPNSPNPIGVLKSELQKHFESESVIRIKLFGSVSTINLAGYRRSELLSSAQGNVFHCFIDEEELAVDPPEVRDIGPRTSPLAELDSYFEGRIKSAKQDEKDILREALQLSRSKLTEAGAW